MSRKADSSLGGIRLFFNDDAIESPTFDINTTTNAFDTHMIKKDVAIKSVTARINPCNSGTYINVIKFNYADGTE